MKTWTHYSENIKELDNLYLILLWVLAVFGFYKNGLQYFWQNQCNLYQAFYPLLLATSGFFLGALLDIKKDHKIGKNALYAFLLTISLPVQTPILYSSLVLVVILILTNYFPSWQKFILILHIILVFLFHLSYANIIENNIPIFYTTIDTFIGKSIGGIGITNIFLLIISYLLLNTKFYYKNDIPWLSLTSYLISTGLYGILIKDSALMFHLLNSSVFYIAIFLLPLNEFSPKTRKGQLIYALISGLILFLSTFINHLEGPFIAYTIIYFTQILSKRKRFVAIT